MGLFSRKKNKEPKQSKYDTDQDVWLPRYIWNEINEEISKTKKKRISGELFTHERGLIIRSYLEKYRISLEAFRRKEQHHPPEALKIPSTMLKVTHREADITPYKPEILGTFLSEANLPGSTLNYGMLRFLNEESGIQAQEHLREMYGDMSEKLTPFAVDWKGEYLCHHRPEEHPEYEVVVYADSAFGPPSSEGPTYKESIHYYLNSPGTFQLFEYDYMEQAFETLKIFEIGFDRCLGKGVPLFLGGQDTPSNLQDISLEVYWVMHGQIYNQVKDLPSGTPITEFKFADEN